MVERPFGRVGGGYNSIVRRAAISAGYRRSLASSVGAAGHHGECSGQQPPGRLAPCHVPGGVYLWYNSLGTQQFLSKAYNICRLLEPPYPIAEVTMDIIPDFQEVTRIAFGPILDSKERCKDCNQFFLASRMVYLHSREVPASLVGWYCPICARSVVSNCQKVCSNCGNVFVIWHPDITEPLCKPCRAKDKYHIKQQVYRARTSAKKAGVEYTLTYNQWMQTLEDYNYKCAYCGNDYYILEHFRPIRYGGGTTAKNCIPACIVCNTRKSNNTPNTTWRGIDKDVVKNIKKYLSKRRI